MAEYRPYRVTNGARARLTQVKLVSVSSFIVLAVLFNWMVTQRAARLFGYSPALGPSLFGLYPPWEWIVWWSRWHGAEQLAPVWARCTREAALPLAALAALAAAAIGVARRLIHGTDSDLHGSAHWMTTREVRAAGLIAPLAYAPQWLRRLGVRIGLLKPRPRRVGIYLGIWRGGWRSSYLRDCGEGHVMAIAPTRSGKGVGIVVPTLLTWPHSALIHDLKPELWRLTAGARKRMGQLCLNFDPACYYGPGIGLRFNPLEEVRIGTLYEVADAQNLAQILVDPDGRGYAEDNHWMAAGEELLTGVILHVLYAEPHKTLRTVAGILSDPEAAVDDALGRMMTAAHDPAGTRGWRTLRGAPTHTHPVVAESMRDTLNRAEKERSGIISEVVKRLARYRDPLIAAATECSEFRIDDLVNQRRPVSLYLTVPYASRERLRPLTRLMLHQIVKRLTEKLAFKDGRPVSAHRWPLLLMLDEFAQFGRFGEFADSMAVMATYGLRACLVLQSLNQIHQLYGSYQTLVENCRTTVRFTPNDIRSAEEISRLVGLASVRHEHRTNAEGGRASVSEPEVGRPLMTPDEVRRMSAEEVLIFTRGQAAARAQLIKYHEIPFFQERAAIAPPKMSDRIISARPPGGSEESQALSIAPSAGREIGTGADAENQRGRAGAGPERRFLSFAIQHEAPKPVVEP